MSRMRGGAVASRTKLKTKSQPKTRSPKARSVKTKKLGTKKLETKKLGTKKLGAKRLESKPERRGRGRDRRDESEDEDARGRFDPPARNDATPAVIAVVVGVILVVLVAVMATGERTNIVDEREADKAYNYVDGQYSLARGGDALAENRVALKKAFQHVADTFPNTDSAKKAEKRIRELQ